MFSCGKNLQNWQYVCVCVCSTHVCKDSVPLCSHFHKDAIQLVCLQTQRTACHYWPGDPQSGWLPYWKDLQLNYVLSCSQIQNTNCMFLLLKRLIWTVYWVWQNPKENGAALTSMMRWNRMITACITLVKISSTERKEIYIL